MSSYFINSNYPATLDVCGACSMRVAGLDDTRPDTYAETMATYAGTVTTSGSRIEPTDDDKTKCDACDEPVAYGEFFDVTARRR
ncbi:MAG: hypothetical protein L0G94_19055 [Brachybacterium sp.]|uniref:hypothetical protein n=1 Tax=Brachybacterium sp. TaxID=1891286 RepID=UPI002648BD6C|nr:hypothetical protein [Brachybacterium sp.]MDN5688754.1 hypothetical protein [Brachybacterium sp.]